MSRPGGGRLSPIGSNVADGDGVNSDECSACGGTGRLLCCDGCTRSYHFDCADPPHEDVPDGEWFCQACALKVPSKQGRGVFVQLLNNLQKRNPVAFELPSAIQDFYEDVVRGDDGEYEDATALSKAKTRNGYDVPADTLRLKDSKDNLILCFKCNESAMGNREIADCDFCNLHWHLDCMDPPLATAPKRFGKGTWRCPAHIDSEIALPRSSSGKSYKIRRQKNPVYLQSVLRRGTKNNGHIEIEDSSSDDEEQAPGTVFRIPSMAIKLDFITQIKKANSEAAQKRKRDEEAVTAGKRRKIQHDNEGDNQTQPKTLAETSNRAPNDVVEERTASERQAAFSLVQFALSDPSVQMSGDRMEQLISTLMAEAPPGTMVNGCSVPTANDSTVDTEDFPTDAKTAAANKGAHATNQATAIQTTPVSSNSSGYLTAQNELAEFLRLEAALKAKIASLRTVTAST
ncbi:MAG: hypothetical protein Q9219_004138 [cf. Caloplaca sp. 3 TL-2023]